MSCSHGRPMVVLFHRKSEYPTTSNATNQSSLAGRHCDRLYYQQSFLSRAGTEHASSSMRSERSSVPPHATGGEYVSSTMLSHQCASRD
ncbi:hypothetical protein PsorP6_015165 [Peronosclerospora sorghi]|uniref:Uncharacterized protein n=1 Tax=Peronosclerospora sorghi TaxID=230839 RepID=A0ACC0VUD8_9STRA|nr:hypothetical protein PsorP6_015165 [Peronosclerospora sorghi]